MRTKGRLGSCPVLDRSSSTWSKTSGDGNRLFVVKLSNLITNLWKEGGRRGRILTPRCLSVSWHRHTVPPRATPGKYASRALRSPSQGMSLTDTGQFIGQILRIIKDNLCFRCLTKKVRYSLSLSDVMKSGSSHEEGVFVSQNK